MSEGTIVDSLDVAGPCDCEKSLDILNDKIDWEKIRDCLRDETGDCVPQDIIRLKKNLLKKLYPLSDAQLCKEIELRESFRRFLEV